jgi:hypothetical protein
MAKKIKVKGFVRKGGVKVKGFTRKPPRLSEEERKKRAVRAKSVLLPAAIRATGKKGFAQTVIGLARHPEIKSPEKLGGWLKAEAKRLGLLSPEHAYRGRKRTLSASVRRQLMRAIGK